MAPGNRMGQSRPRTTDWGGFGNCSISVKPKQAQIAALTHLHVLKTQNHRVEKRYVPFGSNSSTHYLGVQENSIFLIHLVKKSCIYDVSKRRVWNQGNRTGTWGNRRTKCRHHSFHPISCPTPVMLLWLAHLCSGVPRKFTLPPMLFLPESSSSLWPSSVPASGSGSLPQLLRELMMLFPELVFQMQPLPFWCEFTCPLIISYGWNSVFPAGTKFPVWLCRRIHLETIGLPAQCQTSS